MLKRISRFVLRLFGWNTNGALPEEIKKAVVISAPHTSYWDFVIGRLTFWAISANIRFLIKSEVFVGPFGWFLLKIGGLPVTRGKLRSTVVSQVVEMFSTHESLIIVITPEGTRQRAEQWKKGFYLIALEARVPIALSYIDYKKKSGGIGPIIYPSGDYQKDFEFIQDFYRDKTACHPERFNLTPKQN